MPRRPFGVQEEDSPPDMTFREAMSLRFWILSQGPAREIKVVTSTMGGVSRLLERIRDDVGGGPARGRRAQWLVSVIDMSTYHVLFETLVTLRNDILRSTDHLLGPNALQRNFLAFDLTAQVWWRLRRGRAEMSPALYSSDVATFLKWCARLGLSAGVDGVVEIAGKFAEAIADTPLGEEVTDRVTQAALKMAGGMLKAAAGGLLVEELAKGSKANPDIIMDALPELLVEGLRATLNSGGQRRRSRTGEPLRFLLIVDAAEELDVPNPKGRKNIEVVASLVARVAAMSDNRVLIGARDPIHRIQDKLLQPVSHQFVQPFARDNVLTRFTQAGCAEALIDSMLAALCPEPEQSIPAWPLHLVWAHRHDLPPADVARDLNRLARRLGPGATTQDAVEAAILDLFKMARPDLLAELERPYVWMWKVGPTDWMVDHRTAGEGGY